MPPEYTGISILPAARDAIRAFSAKAGGELERRISMSEALMLAVRIATAHLSTDARAAAIDVGIIPAGTEPNGEAQ